MHTDAHEAGRGPECCDYWIMEGQEDLIKDKSLLGIEAIARGHKCIFYPKFHRELNYTKFFWGAVERCTRRNCNYSLEDAVQAGFNSASLA